MNEQQKIRLILFADCAATCIAFILIVTSDYYRNQSIEVGLTEMRAYVDARMGLKKEQQTKPVKGCNYTPFVGLGTQIDMIWVDPGEFTMGSPEDELGRNSDETLHKVTLTEGYWLGKYELTQSQYEAVMGKNPSDFKGADLPVDSVSWFDAREFCKKLTAIEKEAGRLPEGYEYSLPTEAQWEYGCRAGISEKFLLLRDDKDSKEEEDKEVLFGGGFWSDLNSGNKSHPVGQLRPNVWGLYDMSGNVWEWCLDMYNPKESVKSSFRAYRGGSWFSSFMNCRCVSRRNNSPGYQNIDLGFRVALVPAE